jgi:hypothetical protein
MFIKNIIPKLDEHDGYLMCKARESGAISTERHRLVITVHFENLHDKRNDRTFRLGAQVALCRNARGRTAIPLKRATMSRKPGDHH